jgi:integrase
VIEFLYLSGWRKGEALTLEWRDIDLEGRAIRPRIENSKTEERRLLPLTGRLLEIVRKRKALRRLNCCYAFHKNGTRIKEFRKTWKSACIAAGLGRVETDPVTKKRTYHGTIVHDLRRCAARNLSRAGVAEAIAMQFTGHKTNSMYRRYRIVSEDDMREAADSLQAHLARYSEAACAKEAV